MTAPAQDTKAQRKKTRIAHMMLPQIDADSALLPPDKWIVKTTWELIRDNKSVHKTVGGMAGFALAGVATLIAGTIGAFAVAAAAPEIAVGIGALTIAGFFGYKTREYGRKFKAETLPSIRSDVGKKYLDYKVNEVKAAWQRNMEEKRKAREAEKAAKAKAKAEAEAQAKVEPPKVEVKTEAPKTETPKVEAPKVATPQPEAKPAAEAAPEKKAPEKKSLGGAFGEWALKQAAERARKLKEKEQKEDAAPPVVPPAVKPAAPKPPQP
ncbi:MAG: hypothetical protein ACAH80_04045 [Alphaproteobacteria bacterium]